MHPPQFLTTTGIFTGTLFLGASLVLHLRAGRNIPPEIRPQWRLLTGLMAFFLVGYLLFLFIQVEQFLFPIELLISAIFFGGGLFVLVVTRITLRTLRQIGEHEQQLSQINQELLTKNSDLEKEINLRMEAEEQAMARLSHLTSLHDIDTIISASLDLGVTLKVILDQLIPYLTIDAAAVLLFNPQTQTVEYAAGKGFRGQAVTRSRERLGEGSAGKAALARKTRMISDLREDAHDFIRSDLVQEEGVVAYCALPLIAKGTIQGVLEIYRRQTFHPDPEWLEFLESLAIRAAIAIENAALFNELQRSNSELILAYDTTIEGWSRAMELRDRETLGHTQRVVHMTLEIARRFELREEQLAHLTRGALLHDIGKMAIPDTILMKDGPLTEEERELMHLHPVRAMEMLSPIAYLQPALDIPYCHHERWDGTGYPRGLKGEQIPLAARIFAIADTWDALINARRYHEAWTLDKVCTHIEERAGSHFDPEVVKVFLEMEWCRDGACEVPGAC
ncbi:MAG: HD domain-containing protein [Proteobacteria bacterium]|nr:HD domain-containing protein [Pseudomonadota bacterium]MBU1688584.1 HD domain-containing protein [Pseudomonadota bacterium]